MSRFLLLLTLAITAAHEGLRAEAPKEEKPVAVITPGKVIIPFQKMRRIWGELVSVDLETRTGTFRAEGEDKIYSFTAMPYAEMLHHATKGDLSDFEIGERAIFRMHVNEREEWVWLTYIQDEMNMLNGHREYYFVESIDAKTGRIGFTWAKGDKSFIREEGLFLETNDDTKYWKEGKPAAFSNIKIGDMLRTKSHGNGKGRTRVCKHVFLDDASLLKFRDEQIAVQEARLEKNGAAGYVDRIEEQELAVTMFGSGLSITDKVKKGMKVRVAPAGTNLKQTGEAVSGTVVSVEKKGHSRPMIFKLDAPAKGFEVSQVARLWLVTE